MIQLTPIPGAYGDVHKALRNLCCSIPKDTVIVCSYIECIFGKNTVNNGQQMINLLMKATSPC